MEIITKKPFFVKIPVELHTKFKTEAARSDISMSDLFVLLLQERYEND